MSPSSSPNSIAVSAARTITAVSADAFTTSASRGEANVTSPAPARSAARAPMRDAPVAATSPDIASTCPRAYLWPSMRGTGKRGCHSSGSFSNACGLISSSTCASMPMSASRTRPQCCRPGSNRCAGFLRKNVTVSVARTAMPITAPVVPLMPLGRSTASTGAPLALIAAITSWGSPLTGRLRPAPNSASMIKAGLPIACGVNGSTGNFQPLAAEAASPCSASRSHIKMTETSRPCAASSAAATKPSPPLLPGPHTTRIGPSSTRSMAAAATAWPALSISEKPGVPAAIVSRSARSISLVVNTSIAAHVPCSRELLRLPDLLAHPEPASPNPRACRPIPLPDPPIAAPASKFQEHFRQRSADRTISVAFSLGIWVGSQTRHPHLLNL
ncbi:exported hypothetical protein [Bradyrhizobium sp. ORS 375]|nr:exported hypothetical protein [Bradyrhizobium sp. ORS 375]